MPELPEVEVVRQSLVRQLSGVRLLSIHEHTAGILIRHKVALTAPFPAHIEKFDRHGKYLLLSLGSTHQLILHFRMTGNLYFRSPKESLQPHTHLEFRLDNHQRLSFQDPRRFGRVWLLRNTDMEHHTPTLLLGPDARGIPLEIFRERFKTHHRQIKPLLLDQTFIAGLGNIYTDEALFSARIHPLTLSSELGERKIVLLWESIVRILEEAIRQGATTIRNYKNSEGEEGGYQEQLSAYGREGEACLRCRTKIQRIVVGQRGTWFCPRCQKSPASR